MDGTRFDRFTRAFARTGTRRQVVAGLLASAAAVAAPSVAGAARPVCRAALQGCTRHAQCCTGFCRTGRNLPRRERNRCSCPDGLDICAGTCVDLTSDENNCGACGNVCNDQGTCLSGVCQYPDFCLATWGGNFCFQDAEGRIYTNVTYTSIGVRDNAVPCVTSADCPDADICGLPDRSCVCMTLERWDAGAEDYAAYEPRVCIAADPEPACRSDLYAGTGFACLESTEGNTYNPQASWSFDGYCASSADCQALHPTCSQDDTECICMTSYRLVSNSRFGNSLWGQCARFAATV